MPEPQPSAEPLVPSLAIAICIACVAGAGALANCSVLAALFKSSRNGLSSIIIQLAAADLLILGTTVPPELWYYNTRTWVFGNSSCIAYQGLNIFASTVSSYLVATVALHTIATINLEEKAVERKIKRNEEDEDEEIRSSHHSLVAISDSSTPPRTMNLDYRLLDTRVRVTPPTLFIWILAVSLSIPEFVLATTVHLHQDIVLCTAADSHHRFNIHSLLTGLNLFLPLVLMTFAGVLVIIKLKSQRRLHAVYMSESVSTLKLSLCFFIVYGVFCAPRSIFAVYREYLKTLGENEATSFETEMLSDTMIIISLVFSGTYMVAALIRPLLTILLLPKLRKVFSLVTRDMDKV